MQLFLKQEWLVVGMVQWKSYLLAWEFCPSSLKKTRTTHKRISETSTTVAKQCCIEAARLLHEKQDQTPLPMLLLQLMEHGRNGDVHCTELWLSFHGKQPSFGCKSPF